MADDPPYLLPEQDQHRDPCDPRTEFTPLPTVHEKYLESQYHTPDVLYPKVMASFRRLNRRDGRLEGGLYPPSFYAYSDDIKSSYTWEDGLKAIEEGDWSVRAGTESTSNETVALERSQIDDSIVRHPSSLATPQQLDRETCSPPTPLASVPEHQNTDIPQETSDPTNEAVSQSALPLPTLALSIPQVHTEHSVLTPSTCSSSVEVTQSSALQPAIPPTGSDQRGQPRSPKWMPSPPVETSVDVCSGNMSSSEQTSMLSDKARKTQVDSEDVTATDTIMSEEGTSDDPTLAYAGQDTATALQDVQPIVGSDEDEAELQQSDDETSSLGLTCHYPTESLRQLAALLATDQEPKKYMGMVNEDARGTPQAFSREQPIAPRLVTSNLPPAPALVEPSMDFSKILGDDKSEQNIDDASLQQALLRESHQSTASPSEVLVPSQTEEQDKVMQSSPVAPHEPNHSQPDSQDEHADPVTPNTLGAAECLLMLQGAAMRESNTSSLVWPASKTPDDSSSPGMRSSPRLGLRSNSDPSSSPPIDPMLFQLSPNGESRHLPILLEQLALEKTCTPNVSSELEETPSAENFVQPERAHEVLPELNNSNVVSAEDSGREDATAPSFNFPTNAGAIEASTRSQTQEVGEESTVNIQPGDVSTNAPSNSALNAAPSFDSATMDQESSSFDRINYLAYLPSDDGPIQSNPGTSPRLLAGLEEAAAADGSSSTVGETSIITHQFQDHQMPPFPYGNSPERDELLETTGEEERRLLKPSQSTSEVVQDARSHEETATTEASEYLDVSDEESMLDFVRLTPPKPKPNASPVEDATPGARSTPDVSDEESMLDLVKLTPPKPKSDTTAVPETTSQSTELVFRRSERLASVGARKTPDVSDEESMLTLVKLTPPQPREDFANLPTDTTSNIRSTSPDVSDEESMLTLVKLTPPSQRKPAAMSLEEGATKSESDALGLMDDPQEHVKDSGEMCREQDFPVESSAKAEEYTPEPDNGKKRLRPKDLKLTMEDNCTGTISLDKRELLEEDVKQQLPAQSQKQSRTRADASSASVSADACNIPHDVPTSENDVPAIKKARSVTPAKTANSKGKTAAQARNVRTRSQACDDAEEKENMPGNDKDKDTISGGPRGPAEMEASSSELTSADTSPFKASAASSSSTAAHKKYSPRRIDLPSADYAKKFGFGRPTTRGESRVAKKTSGGSQDAEADKDAESEAESEDTAPPVILRARGRVKGKAHVKAALRAALHSAAKPAEKPAAKPATRTAAPPKLTLKSSPASAPKTPAVTTPKKTRATTAAAAMSEKNTSPTNSWGFRSRRAAPGTGTRKRKISVDDTDAADADFAPAGKKTRQNAAASASEKTDGVEAGAAAKRTRPARKK